MSPLVRLLCFVFLSSTLGSMVHSCKSTEEASKELVVRAHLATEPDFLHPYNLVGKAQMFIDEYLHRTLVRMDPRSQQLVPLLCKALPTVSADGKEYTFELRDDVMWDDGSALTAKDLVFSYYSVMVPGFDNPAMKDFLKNLEKVSQGKTDREVVFTFKEFSFFDIYSFADVQVLQSAHYDPKNVLENVTMAMLKDSTGPRYAALLKWGQSFDSLGLQAGIEKLQGLGPYKVEHWEKGAYISLVRKEKWWGQNDTFYFNKANPKKIIFNVISDGNAVYNALLNEELDVSTYVNTPNYRKLLGDSANKGPGFHLSVTEGTDLNTLTFNYKTITKNHRLRKALSHAILTDTLMQQLSSGFATRQASYVLPFMKKHYNAELPLIRYDKQKATALLAEYMKNSGQKEVTIRFAYRATQESNAKILAQGIEDACKGIKVKLTPVSNVGEVLGTDKYDLLYFAFSTSARPESPGQMFHSSAANSINNYRNRVVDALITRLEKQKAEDSIMVISKQLQKVLYDDYAFIPLYTVQPKVVVSKKFKAPLVYVDRPTIYLGALELAVEGEGKK